MNKQMVKGLGVGALALMGVVMMSALPADGILTRQGDVTVVNTTQLTQGVKGYRGPTPVKIFIKKGKVQKIEVLPNKETPRFFAKVKQEMVPRWEGKSVKKAAALDVDGVTGATFSSKAIKQNVKAGLAYYQTHQ